MEFFLSLLGVVYSVSTFSLAENLGPLSWPRVRVRLQCLQEQHYPVLPLHAQAVTVYLLVMESCMAFTSWQEKGN